MPKKKWFWNDLSDALLRRTYDPTVPGRSNMLANRLRVPRWAVNRRAAALGLSRQKERPWSPAERAYLESNFHHVSVKALARRFGRSPTAVRLKAKRLGLRKSDECYTACSLAQRSVSTRTGCLLGSGPANCGRRTGRRNASPSRAAIAG